MYGQYNPYMGATPQMQQRLNYLQQQQQQMYQPTMQQPMTVGKPSPKPKNSEWKR